MWGGDSGDWGEKLRRTFAKKELRITIFCAKTSTTMFQIVTHLKCGLSVSEAGLIQTRESL